MDDWNQLREAGFPVDRVWEQGMPLDIPGEEDLTFSSSLMNVRQQSQASEVETQEDVLQNLHVDHNLLFPPILQAMFWLADIILSLDGTLHLEVVSRPTFNIQAIDSTIHDMQLQLNELTEQRHQIELSVVAICLTRMMVALVKLTVQLGLQFHMGVIITHCLTNGFWNRETLSSLRPTEVVNVVLLIPIKTIWTWIPNVFSFSCVAVLQKTKIDGAARWYATTLRLRKTVVDVKLAIFNLRKKEYARHVQQPSWNSKAYKVLKGMVTLSFMFSLHYKVGKGFTSLGVNSSHGIVDKTCQSTIYAYGTTMNCAFYRD